MGNCIYCGQKVSLFKKEHPTCKENYFNGIAKITNLFNKVVTNNKKTNIKQEAQDIAKSNFIREDEIDKIFFSQWEKEIDKAFEDDILTEDEEEKLIEIAEDAGLKIDVISKTEAYNKIVKGGVLREIYEGKIPQRIKINGSLPINYQKNENLIWVFNNVELLEDKVKREYVGGYHGVSVKIAKGLYYRTGSFKGNPVERVQTTAVDNGLFAVTNRHIYFVGSRKSFKIPYNKIISFQQYSNGIGIMKDGVTAKPLSFITNDGWFTYNLITNLARSL